MEIDESKYIGKWVTVKIKLRDEQGNETKLIGTAAGICHGVRPNKYLDIPLEVSIGDMGIEINGEEDIVNIQDLEVIHKGGFKELHSSDSKAPSKATSTRTG